MITLTNHRRLSAAAISAAIILLAGCTAPTQSSTSESATPSARGAAESATPQPSDAAEASIPSDLSFDAGTLAAMRNIEVGWGESLGLYPDSFRVVKKDMGDASWSYEDAATKCQIGFRQGSVADVLDTTQDDRTITDDLLASIIVVPTNGVATDKAAADAYDQVRKGTVDDVVSQIPGPGSVDTRTLSGAASNGEAWLHSARAFGSIAVAVVIDVTCPSGQDVQAEYKKVVDTYVGLRVQPHTTE